MLDGISIIGLTPTGLLLVTVLMILTGRLIPRSTYLDKVKECDRWREAYEVERVSREASDAQTRELLELAKTGTKVLEAVHHNSEMMKSGDS
jgi:hypothetical protein